MYIEHQVQKIRPGKWAELDVIDKKFNSVESREGFPSKRRMRCYIGGYSINTLIVEREWNSLSEMEAAYMKLFMDPDWQTLASEFDTLCESTQYEIYMVLA